MLKLINISFTRKPIYCNSFRGFAYKYTVSRDYLNFKTETFQVERYQGEKMVKETSPRRYELCELYKCREEDTKATAFA